MDIINAILIIILVICAIAVERTKDLVSAIIIFSAYSLFMSVVWLLLKSPDVALTEAAIGAGVTSILFFAVISKTERFEK
jgi:uncharacterized MnhB-related membrane protein